MLLEVLEPRVAPGWNWRLKLRPRPKLTADSPVFRANAASIRRWCESPEPHKAPPPTPRRPPPADWRTPRRMGGFEILVILALVRQDGGGCASDVRALIASRTGRLVSIHSVAKAIQRLLKRRYVCPAPAPHRWRDFFTSRKFYRVEPLGRRAARLTLLAGDRMREGIVGLHPGSVGLGAEVPEPGTERRPQFRPA